MASFFVSFEPTVWVFSAYFHSTETIWQPILVHNLSLLQLYSTVKYVSENLLGET